jgi:hypothetical protein
MEANTRREWNREGKKLCGKSILRGKREILNVIEVFTLYAEKDNPRGGSAYCILNSRESSVVFGIAKQCPPPTHNEEY